MLLDSARWPGIQYSHLHGSEHRRRTSTIQMEGPVLGGTRIIVVETVPRIPEFPVQFLSLSTYRGHNEGPVADFTDLAERTAR